jgi:hypothetical protein
MATTVRTHKAITLCYSYAHADEALRQELEKHLATLKRQRYISAWHDRQITPGMEWEAEINKYLETADIILLLVSADFIASDYCYGKEMKLALKRHRLHTARVLPIILRPADWQSTPLGKLQVLPKDGKPIVSWSSIDEGLLDVARGIRIIIEEMRKNEKQLKGESPVSSIRREIVKRKTEPVLPHLSENKRSEERETKTTTLSANTLKDKKLNLRFLTLTPEELIARYREESLLTLAIELPDISLPQAVTDEQGHLILPQAITYENLAHLPIDAFRFQVDTQSPNYTLPIKIKSKAEQLLAAQQAFLATNGKTLFDSSTIRLNRLEQSVDSATFIVSKAHYFDYVSTNYSIDAHLDDWRSSLRDSVHPENRLEPLDSSLLANHIGLGALLFTADDFVVLPIRSKDGVNIWQGAISPSVSGATNYGRDINYFTTEGKIISWIVGEAAEELNLEWNHIDAQSFTLLGVTRELLRGGKPEMFFSARLTISRSEVEQRFTTAQDRAENTELVWMDMPHPVAAFDGKYLVELREDIQHLLVTYGERMSQPALANLALYYRWYEQKAARQNEKQR